MCFSPTASFTAAGVLGVTGIATLASARHRSEWPLASVPLIFALQQFIEGFVWLSLLSGKVHIIPLAYAYTFFALLFWPVFVPWVVWSLETDAMRKKLMVAIGIVGAATGLALYGMYILRGPQTEIVNQCVYYNVTPIYPTLFTCLYALATFGAPLLSSRRFINLFGLLVGISSIVAWIFYTETFSSVWCFFAAALSFLLLFFFRRGVRS